MKNRKNKEAEQSEEIQEDMNPIDPSGAYREPFFAGPADSPWEKFRRWSHRQKRIIYLILALAIVASLGLFFRPSEPGSVRAIAAGYFARFTKQSPDWAYSVDGHFIDRKHLSLQYPILARYTWGSNGARAVLNDRQAYAKYVRAQLETDLLVRAALKEGVLEDTEARIILENGVRRLVADYYLSTRLKNKKTNFRVAVTAGEISKHYARNKKFYTARNLDENQAKAVIRRSLLKAKQDAVQADLSVFRNATLRDLQETLGYKIRRGK